MRVADQQTEQALMQAVSRVTAAMEDGSAPTDAVVKVASDLRLTPGAVEIVCRAANIGMTNARRTAGLTLQDKTAAFPLADAAEACRQLWPDSPTPKTAAVSDDYDYSPRFFQTQHTERTRKSADEQLRQRPLPVPLEVAKRATAEAQAERREALTVQARTLRCAATEQFGEAVAKLAAHVRSANFRGFDDFRNDVAQFYGAAAAPVLRHLELALGTIPAHKRASYGLREFSADERQLLDAVFAAARTCKQAEDICEALDAPDPDAVDEEPPAPTETMLDLSDKTAAGPMQLPTNLAWMAGSLATFKNQANQAAVAAQNRATQAYAAGLTDPQHEQTLEDIRAKAMLHALLIDDEIIGGYDPREVVAAYNDIRATSPALATNQGAVRPLLRKRLEQGGLADFDVAQIADIQKALPTPAGLSLSPSYSSPK